MTIFETMRALVSRTDAGSSSAAAANEGRQDAAGYAMVGGWYNPSTGQGDPMRDKAVAAVWLGGVPMHEELLASLFTFNDLARAICMALPDWALRNGWELAVAGDAVSAQAIGSGVRTALSDLKAHEHELAAAVWGQTFGGGLLLIGADDGRAYDQPLDETRLKAVRWLRHVPRRYVTIEGVYADPTRPMFGEPAIYGVRDSSVSQAEMQRFHASRVIRYPGPLTEPWAKAQNKGWDQSILDVVVSTLRKHNTMWDDVGGMTHDGSQGVWKIKGLVKAALTGRMAELQERFRIADQTRSIFRSLLLDADGEEFSYVHRNFGGIADLLAQSAIRTAGAAQMPVTVLFGQSPAGMNATGESDIRLWYDRVEAYQGQVLLSRIERLVRLILVSKEGPTKGVEPEAWTVVYRPVRKATPMEQAELRARQAQIDASNIATRVVMPEEVAVSRFTASGWSSETHIDTSWRSRFLRYAGRQIENQAAAIFPDQLRKWMGLLPEGAQPTESVGAGTLPPGDGAPLAVADAISPIWKEIRKDALEHGWSKANVRALEAAFVRDARELGASQAMKRALDKLLHLPPLEPLGTVRVDGRTPDDRHDAAGSDGVMIAVFLEPELAEQLALEYCEPADQLHITLAYLGKRAELGDDAIAKAAEVVRGLTHDALEGHIGGPGRFSPKEPGGPEPFFATVHVPGLTTLYVRLLHRLLEAGVPVSMQHGFVPHITLAYLWPEEPAPLDVIASRPIDIQEVTLSVGGERVASATLTEVDDA